MYNEKIISRLENLTYLGTIKNSNVSIMSKANEFGDVVKFFAQINTDDVIQNISFKATGCTPFLALCSYFCESVINKKVDSALKINESYLEKFCILEESKKHVYPIILNTFALLIKKYRKGVEKGEISPCAVQEVKTVSIAKEDKKIKTNTVSENHGLEEILVKEKPASKKKTETKDNLAEIKKINKEINDIEKPDEKPQADIVVKEEKIEQKPKKKKESILKDSSNTKEEKTSKKENNLKKKVTKEKNIEVVEIPSETKNSSDIKEETSKIDESKNINAKSHVSNLQSLTQKVSKQNTATTEKTHANNLSSMLNKLQKSENDNKKKIDAKKEETTKKQDDSINNLTSMRSSLQNIRKQKEESKEVESNITTKEKKTKKENKTKEIESKTKKEEIMETKEEPQKAEKKSLFSWFKRKK